MRFLDLKGEKIDRLLVVDFAGYKQEGRHRRAMWVCLCDCGNEIQRTTHNLRCKGVKSCGCWQKDNNPQKTHGKSHSRTFRIWWNMMTRCYLPSATSYPRYGGRGITVGDRWRKFENFLEDMGESPSGMTLDRIDNLSGYCKSNCKWSTPKEQASNKRNNIWLTIGDVTKTQEQWAEYTGIPSSRIHRRICELGWSVEKAIMTPVGKK